MQHVICKVTKAVKYVSVGDLKYSICLLHEVEWKYKVAENRNTPVKYQHLNILFKYCTWVNVLCYTPSPDVVYFQV